MQLDHLNVLAALLTVAEERSFAKAAKRLGVSRSASSHAVRGLEERLGVRLLARTTRSVAPREAGEQLIRRLGLAWGEVESILEQIVELREQPTGRVGFQRDMVAVRVSRDQRLAVVGSPTYFAAHPQPNSPHDLYRRTDASICEAAPRDLRSGKVPLKQLRQPILTVQVGTEVRC